VAAAARGAPLLDSSSFGTGVAFDLNPATERLRPPNPAAEQAASLIRPFHPVTEESGDRGNPEKGHLGSVDARARADFQNFEVGASAWSLNASPDEFSPVFATKAMAVAYTGLVVSDNSPTTLPGVLVLHGNFREFGLNADRAGSRALLDIWDLSGKLLGEIITDSGGYYEILSGDNLQTVERRFDGWPGSRTLPFLLPLGAEDNGIIARLWVAAEAGPGNDFAADFLTTATLTFLPPPGVTVTLATGQVFVGVPEPSTHLLMALGAAAIGCTYLERKRGRTRLGRTARTTMDRRIETRQGRLARHDAAQARTYTTARQNVGEKCGPG
jgi:hypothetical protein